MHINLRQKNVCECMPELRKKKSEDPREIQLTRAKQILVCVRPQMQQFNVHFFLIITK